LTWQGEPLETQALEPRERLWIGTRHDVDIRLPVEGEPWRRPLATRSEGGFQLHVPEAAEASVWRDGELAVRGSALTPRSDQSVEGEVTGESFIVLDRATRAELRFGDLSLRIELTDRVHRRAYRGPVDWKPIGWIGASFLAHGFVLALMALSPPRASAIVSELDAERARALRYRLAEPEPPAPEAPPVPSAAGGQGERSARDEGTVGPEEAPQNEGGGTRLKVDAPSQTMPVTAESAKRAGVLGVLAKVNHGLSELSHVFGKEQAEGAFEDDALGAYDRLLGIGQGTGGLTMTGVGRGGGCKGRDCARGTVGLGKEGLGTLGSTCPDEVFERLVAKHGRAGALERCAGGPGGTGVLARRGLGDRQGDPPTLRSAKATTTGALSAEQIRRVVHRNLGQVRFCYEQGLRERPDLRGRVAVKFLIQPSGAVQSVAVAGTSLDEPQTERCVASKVQTWSFPRSPGVSAVTYPFVFTPAGG
jgi:hypothetical protein